jgi:hypothetical protein
MYGTNEDLHAPAISAPRVPATFPDTAVENSGALSSEASGLGELLHKVWKNLSGKQ